MIRAAARIYASRWRMFIRIGFPTVPASLLVAVSASRAPERPRW